MDEAAGGRRRCAIQNRPLPAATSPPPSISSVQTWLLVNSPLRTPWMKGRQADQDSQGRHGGTQSNPPSRFFKELFCTSHASGTLASLTGSLMTSLGPQSDVVKQGYLGTQERSYRSYFVLRAGSHTGPSRLEWYKSQENFIAMERSAGKAALFGSSKKGEIYLRCCLGVSRMSNTRKGHTLALYAKDHTTVLVLEDQWEQEEWYLAVRRLMEEERKDEEPGEGCDEEDDGYCTLPPAAFFKEVWPVTVKPTDLGTSKSLAGESWLCLTASSFILIRVGAYNDLPSVTIPLLSVRRFGHLDGSFFIELGRSAPSGPGEIWMEASDQGNPAAAQHIHEVIRETVRALRALPDFSRSPTSSHNQLQTLLASKRCRPKYRDKLLNVRPLGSRLTRNPAQSYLESHKAEPESPLRPLSEIGGYVEMKMDHHPPLNKEGESDCSVAACGAEGWEPSEEESLGYMMMSPQMSHSLSVLPREDYVTMASPQKHGCPADSSFQTSFNNSSSEGYSPLRLSHQQTHEHCPPHWLLTSEAEAGQSQRSTSCPTRPLDDERTSAERGRVPARTMATWSPVGIDDVSSKMTPVASSGSVYSGSVQTSPICGSVRSSRLQTASDQSVRRYRLSLCLPSCLRTEDRSEC